MLNIDGNGMVYGNARIQPRRFFIIERGPMVSIAGIIVHQTGSSSAQSTFGSYRIANAKGAHFLIDKNGVIYQTASVLQRTNHVGQLRARCLVEMRCQAAEFRITAQFPEKKLVDRMHRIEMQKSVPLRYPSNTDSLGIEIVGRPELPPGKRPPPDATPRQREIYFNENAVYEAATVAQNMSLQWLVAELTSSLSLPEGEVHRHSQVSRKNPTEAITAAWK